MKYYKLSIDTDRENDVVLHFENSAEIELNAFSAGKRYDDVDGLNYPGRLTSAGDSFQNPGFYQLPGKLDAFETSS